MGYYILYVDEIAITWPFFKKKFKNEYLKKHKTQKRQPCSLIFAMSIDKVLCC